MKPKVFVVGHKGWIGKMLVRELTRRNVDVSVNMMNQRAESLEFLENIKQQSPTHVVCCAGRTHGKGYSTIDYLESPDTLEQNLCDNFLVPVQLAHLCQEIGAHFTYLGTGCVYSSSPTQKSFSEYDAPNFFGSNYSIVKGMTNNYLNKIILNDGTKSNVLHLRIRMPITSQDHPRNFVSKLISYEKICSIPNSMTVLDEMIPIMVAMILEKTSGCFNMTNPGVVSHNEVLSMYRDIVDREFSWTNFTIEEQDQLLLSKRSNNELNTSKLEAKVKELRQEGLYPELSLSEIKEAVKKALKNWRV